MVASTQIVFRRAVPEDREALRSALARFFYAEEPLNNSYHAGPEVTSDDMEFSLSLIEEGFVSLAVDEASGGVIVGLCCGAFIEPDEAEKMLELAGRAESKKFGDVLLLLAHLLKEANMFERYGVSKVYHIHCLGVDPNLRGRSLGKSLVEKQFEYASSCGVKMISTDTTGIYSAKLFQRSGMECIHCMRYDEYRNEQGQQVFLSKEPHLEVRTLVKIL